MKWLAVLLLVLGSEVVAQEKDPRPQMHLLAQEIASLQKYLLSESEFTSPANESNIESALSKMNNHLNALGNGTFKDDPALRANLSLLTTHMKDAEKFFKEGNKPFSRFMVQSSMQMCIACHTRGKSEYDFALPEDAMKGAPPLEKANFLFATRQFEKGKTMFEEVVAGYPGNKIGAFALKKALLSLAVYYARVKEDAAGGRAYFAKVAARNDIPHFLQREVKAWAEDFQAWTKEGKRVSTKATETELVAEAKRLLRSDDFSLVGDSDRRYHIRRLRASGILHKALEAPGEKSPAKGEALFYLGQIYHRIDHQLFFRFGEMYLKSCIRDYKKTKIAKDCYNALEQAVTEGYTGSAGTNIPEEEEVELFQLKRLAY